MAPPNPLKNCKENLSPKCKENMSTDTRVTFKQPKDQPLTSHKKRENKRHAKVRAREEHVFSSLETAIGGKRLRCIGIDRASIQIGLQNLLYNMHRFVYLEGATTRCTRSRSSRPPINRTTPKNS